MSHHFGRARLALLIVLAAAALLSSGGCKPSPSLVAAPSDPAATGKPAEGGVLDFYIGEPSGIDPYHVSEPDGAQVAQAIFDSLVQVDPLDPRRVLPSAAETWSVNADGTVWTFVLDPDGHFHEGTPVTADDFVYAWNRIVDPETVDEGWRGPEGSAIVSQLAPIVGWDSVRRGIATSMSGLKAVDNRTLQVTLKQPFADFIHVVASPALAPVPKKYVESGVVYENKKLPFVEMPIGNGPFKMSAPWQHDETIKVVRNGDYYGTAPHLDAVNFHIFLDPKTACARFLDGELDFSRVPVDQIGSAIATGGISPDGCTASPGKQTLRGPEYALLYLAVNTSDPILGNAGLRKAISMALDRASVCSEALGGAYSEADNAVPEGIPGYEPGAWTDARYDRKAAKSALATAGYPKGNRLPEITLAYAVDSDSASAMTLVQENLAAIGVRVRLEPVDERVLIQKTNAGDFQIACLSRRAESPTMDDFVQSLFDDASGQNVSAYANSSFSRGLVLARATKGATARAAKYRELVQLVQSANPIVPLAFYRHSHVASNRVHDLVLSGQNAVDFSRVWVTGASSSSR